MKLVTTELDAVMAYIKGEFGLYLQCPCSFLATPPIGAPLEVLEPLETQPSAAEAERALDYGLTADFCIPPGIYSSIREIIPGPDYHYMFLEGWHTMATEKTVAKRVNPPPITASVFFRVSEGFNIDWRAVKAWRGD